MRTCPLGHTCDSCLLHIDLEHQHEDGTIERVKKCAFVATVHAQVATFQQTYSMGAALESTRNVAARIERDGKNGTALNYAPTEALS